MFRTLLIFTLSALAAGLAAQTTPDTKPPEQAAVFSVWSQRMDMSR